MIFLIQLTAAAIFYIVSVLAIFWEPLIDKFGSIQWDAVSVHFFNLFFSSETWSKGIIPLWTPYIFAGFPQVADLQVAFFYPINFFIGTFAVFTPELMMDQIAVHYFLAGFFAFLFAKYLSKNFWFSIAAGLVYSLGGFMVGHASHVGMQNTAAWLPLIFLFLILALKKEKTLFAALCGLFLGIAILAGHFQMSLYIAYAVAFYFAFDVIWALAGSFKKTGKEFAFLIFIKIRLVFIIYTIAFLVSAIQLLPTFELTQLSNRAKISLEMSQTESLNPASLKSLIEPNYNNVAYGDPYRGPWDRTQNYLYIGTAIIILAVMGAIAGVFYQRTRKSTIFWILLLTFSLLYSFGEFGFLQKYFYRFVPFFDKTRAPSNMMLLLDLAVIALASMLFNNLANIFKKFNEPLPADILRSPLTAAKKIFLKYIPSIMGIGALAIISMQIFPAASQPNTLLYNRQKISEVVAAPPIAARIAEEYNQLSEINKFKIFKVPGLDYNLTQVLHFFAFDGYNPLSLKRHTNYIDTMVKNAKLVDLAGIKYLPCEFISAKAPYLEKIGSLCVNTNYFKFAFLANDYLIAKNETEALQKIQEVNLEKIIVLEEDPLISAANSNNSNNATGQTNELSLIEFKPGLWRFETNSKKNTFLVINQANYPGWTAKIDGAPAKIFQANYLFQAIPVPSGNHEIIVKYESGPLIFGAILAIIGLSAVFLIVLNDFYRKQKSLQMRNKSQFSIKNISL